DQPVHLHDGPLARAKQLLTFARREIELGEHLHRGADHAKRIAQIVCDNAEHVLTRARHHLRFTTSVALTLEDERSRERTSRRLRQQLGKRAIVRAERRSGAETEYEAADELVA